MVKVIESYISGVPTAREAIAIACEDWRQIGRILWPEDVKSATKRGNDWVIRFEVRNG